MQQIYSINPQDLFIIDLSSISYIILKNGNKIILDANIPLKPQNQNHIKNINENKNTLFKISEPINICFCKNKNIIYDTISNFNTTEKTISIFNSKNKTITKIPNNITNLKQKIKNSHKNSFNTFYAQKQNSYSNKFDEESKEEKNFENSKNNFQKSTSTLLNFKGTCDDMNASNYFCKLVYNLNTKKNKSKENNNEKKYKKYIERKENNVTNHLIKYLNKTVRDDNSKNIFKNIGNNNNFEKRVDKIKNENKVRSYSLNDMSSRIKRIHKKYVTKLVFPRNSMNII